MLSGAATAAIADGRGQRSTRSVLQIVPMPRQQRAALHAHPAAAADQVAAVACRTREHVTDDTAVGSSDLLSSVVLLLPCLALCLTHAIILLTVGVHGCGCHAK